MTGKFLIYTLGCKVNQYETRQIHELLEALGLRAVEPAEKPDMVIVNSCCVTGTASAKSRQYAARARKINPEAIVIIRGCLPSAPTGELGEIDNGVHRISHQQDLRTELTRIIETADRALSPNPSADTISKPDNAHKIKHKNNLDEGEATSYERRATGKNGAIHSFGRQSRAFLKIQDGCDGFCSYCIVRKIRNELSSKQPEAVIAEARNLVEAGHKEIVLTGIFLGAYGRETVRRTKWAKLTTEPLSDLLGKLVQVPGLARLRLSSLEPADVTPQLLDTFCRHKDVIVPHLHLPLQSGSEIILKKMCRQYSAADFVRVTEMLKSRLDRPAITTDIIVGFPGETEQDFEETVEMTRRVGFAKMHIFPFSARKGTPAAEMKDKVKSTIIKERARVLSRLDQELQIKFRYQFVGDKATIIVENTVPCPAGRSERYFMLKAPPQKVSKGALMAVTITPESFLPDKE